MKKKWCYSRLLSATISLGIFISLFACGGGGGDGSDNSYNGLTTPAVINETIHNVKLICE